MKILRNVGIALGAIIALLLIVAAFEPAQTQLEKTIVINKPAPEVYAFVSDLRNFDKWNYWKREKEPTAKVSVSEQYSGVGATYTWEGTPDNTGTGTMTIASVEENKSISQKMQFKVPREGEAMAGLKLEPVEGGTKVVYWFDGGNASYPVDRLAAMIFVKPMLNGAYEKSLAFLKQEVESMPSPTPESPKADEAKTEKKDAKP
jgi:hypothetical protein